MSGKASAIVLLLCALSTPTFGQDGLALMKVETGARPSGMGAAFVSVTDDPNSTAYNPGGVGPIDGFFASFGHNAYWDNVRIETGYFALGLSRRVRLHSGLRFAAIDELESRLGPTSEPDAYFDAHDVSFKSGLTVEISRGLTAGFAAGWFVEKIDQYRGSAFNVDLGLVYEPRRGLSFGAAAQNLGSDLSLSLSGRPGSTAISLPATYRFGGSYRYDKYLGAADLVVIDDEAHLHLGIEGWMHPKAAVRAGYMAGYDTKNITAGATFKHRNFGIDYAFVPYSDNLGTSHLFNLTILL